MKNILAAAAAASAALVIAAVIGTATRAHSETAKDAQAAAVIKALEPHIAQSMSVKSQVYIKFGTWYAWINYGNDGQFSGIELAVNYPNISQTDSEKPRARWYNADASGKLTYAQILDAANRELGPVPAEQITQDMSSAATAVVGSVSESYTRSCSGAGSYEDHRMGCCEGTSPQRVSNDAYICQ